MKTLTNKQIRKLHENANAIKAMAEGKAIQYKASDGSGWVYSTGNGPGTGNLTHSTYRPDPLNKRTAKYSDKKIQDAIMLHKNAHIIEALANSKKVEYSINEDIWHTLSVNLSIARLRAWKWRVKEGQCTHNEYQNLLLTLENDINFYEKIAPQMKNYYNNNLDMPTTREKRTILYSGVRKELKSFWRPVFGPAYKLDGQDDYLLNKLFTYFYKSYTEHLRPAITIASHDELSPRSDSSPATFFYAYDTNTHPDLNKKEIPMPEIKYTDTVLTINYLFGQPLDKVSDEKIIERISQLRADANAFPDLKSENIKKRINAIEKTIEGLITILDDKDRIKDL